MSFMNSACIDDKVSYDWASRVNIENNFEEKPPKEQNSLENIYCKIYVDRKEFINKMSENKKENESIPQITKNELPPPFNIDEINERINERNSEVRFLQKF